MEYDEEADEDTIMSGDKDQFESAMKVAKAKADIGDSIRRLQEELRRKQREQESLEREEKRARELQRQIKAKAVEAKKSKASSNADLLDKIRDVIRGELAEALRSLAASNEQILAEVKKHPKRDPEPSQALEDHVRSLLPLDNDRDARFVMGIPEMRRALARLMERELRIENVDDEGMGSMCKFLFADSYLFEAEKNKALANCIDALLQDLQEGLIMPNSNGADFKEKFRLHVDKARRAARLARSSTSNSGNGDVIELPIDPDLVKEEPLPGSGKRKARFDSESSSEKVNASEFGEAPSRKFPRNDEEEFYSDSDYFEEKAFESPRVDKTPDSDSGSDARRCEDSFEFEGKDDPENPETDLENSAKRGRGRPKGSKNKKSHLGGVTRDLVTSVKDPIMSHVYSTVLESPNGDVGDNSTDGHSDNSLDLDDEGNQVSSFGDENFYQFYATRSGRITKKEIVRSKSEAKRTKEADEEKDDEDQTWQPKSKVHTKENPDQDTTDTDEPLYDESGGDFDSTLPYLESLVVRKQRKRAGSGEATHPLLPPGMILVEATESYMSKSVPGKVLHRRRHPCFYCDIFTEQIYRHMLSKHRGEKSIVQIEDLRGEKDNDEVRINLMRILKNKCDFKHNLAVLKENRGMLRVTRRPVPGTSLIVDPEDYMPCSSCFAFHRKRELWRHRCPATGTRASSEQSALADSSFFLAGALGRKQVSECIFDDMII